MAFCPAQQADALRVSALEAFDDKDASENAKAKSSHSFWLSNAELVRTIPLHRTSLSVEHQPSQATFLDLCSVFLFLVDRPDTKLKPSAIVSNPLAPGNLYTVCKTKLDVGEW